MQRLRSSDSGHFSSHSALSSLRLFALLAFWRIFLSPRPLVQALGNCPASELHGLPPSELSESDDETSQKGSTTSRALTKTKKPATKTKDKTSASINSRLNVVVRSPTPFGLGRNGCWPSRGSQLPRALPLNFSLCCPLNDRRRAAHSFFKIGRLFFLSIFSCPCLFVFVFSFFSFS